MDNQLTMKPNERGEFEVAKGVSANLFRAVLVRRGEGDGLLKGGRETEILVMCG